MTPLEFLLLVAAGLLVVGLVGYVSVLVVIALAVGRLLTAVGQFIGTSADATGRSLADLEAHLESLALAAHIDTGVVCSVEPERRRPRGVTGLFTPPRDGVRIDVAVPSPERAVTSIWFALPDSLRGESALERFLGRAGIAADELSELVGREVPVELTDRGTWRVQWEVQSAPTPTSTRYLAHVRTALAERS
ncbi:MAG: hypothetical protein ACQETI_10855 [Halobacteriota archaeon]